MLVDLPLPWSADLLDLVVLVGEQAIESGDEAPPPSISGCAEASAIGCGYLRSRDGEGSSSSVP